MHFTMVKISSLSLPNWKFGEPYKVQQENWQTTSNFSFYSEMLNPIIGNHTQNITFKKPYVSHCQRLFVESRLSFSYMSENGRAICISLLPSVIYITICLNFISKNIARKINSVTLLIDELIQILFF